MQPAPLAPKLHVFVCCNRREPASALGAGCGDRGEAVYAALKDEVAKRGEIASTWITRAFCLGICPKAGATVAVHGAGAPRVLTEVGPEDAPRVLAEAKPLELALAELEAHQRDEVAKLSAPDGQYEHGMLAGIQAVAAALRARS
jgi:(2Fe-2S) ferredoxin